jgi:hypothetical protein
MLTYSNANPNLKPPYIFLSTNKWSNSLKLTPANGVSSKWGYYPYNFPISTNEATTPSIPHALKWSFSSPFFHLGRMASLYNQKTISISSRATILDFSKGSFKDPSIHAPKVHSSFIQFIPPTSSFNPQLHALTNG